MTLLKILNVFRKSRINGKRLDFEQRRSIFKYHKFEPQEKMDGAAKSEQFFKKVPRESVLAPKFRLRPYSPRLHATEVMEFLKYGKPMNTFIAGVFIIYSFACLLNTRREAEQTLIEYYHPDKDTEVRFPSKEEENLTAKHIVFDTLEGEHLKE